MNPAWIAAGAGIAGDLLGGLFGNSAQSSANRTNIMLARENRDWEERMSNTAWQRGTTDMLKAGMNPMLGFSQGPASTPTTSAATVQPVDAMARAVTSAGSKAAQALQLENMSINNRILREKAEQEIVATHRLQNMYGTGEPTEVSRAEAERIIADAKAAVEKAGTARIERELAEATYGANVNSARALAQIREREVTLNEARELLLRLEIPEKQAMAKWFETVGSASPAAKAVMTIGQWLKMILGR